LLGPFSGYITSPFTWHDVSVGYVGNFVVDKSSGKCYLSQGFNFTGAEVIRINDVASAYDGWRNTASGDLDGRLGAIL
jgi:hypothetical protein